jgi:hypothetical protein
MGSSAIAGFLRFLLQKNIPATMSAITATPPTTPPAIAPAGALDDSADGEDIGGPLGVVELTGDDSDAVELVRGVEDVDEDGDELVEELVDVTLRVSSSRARIVVVEKFAAVVWPAYVVYAPCARPPVVPTHW